MDYRGDLDTQYAKCTESRHATPQEIFKNRHYEIESGGTFWSTV